VDHHRLAGSEAIGPEAGLRGTDYICGGRGGDLF